MNLKEIKELINLMNEHNLGEIEVEKDGLKVRLKKQAGGQIETITEHVVHAPAARKELSSKPAGKFRETVEIKAPMVGTFYAAPSPDTKPFVEIGSKIQTGDVVCIIEAMKLMNEIKSEVKGKIVEVLIENGSPIEFGQVLFLVEPA